MLFNWDFQGGIMGQSIWQSWAFEFLKIGSFKFPAPLAKITLKCSTQVSDLMVRCCSKEQMFT